MVSAFNEQFIVALRRLNAASVAYLFGGEPGRRMVDDLFGPDASTERKESIRSGLDLLAGKLAGEGVLGRAAGTRDGTAATPP